MSLEDAASLEKTLESEGYNAHLEYDAMMAEFTGEEIKSERKSESEKGDLETNKTQERDTESQTSEKTSPDEQTQSDVDTGDKASASQSADKEGDTESRESKTPDKTVENGAKTEDDPLTRLQSSINARVRKTEGKLGEVNMRLQELTNTIKNGHSESKAQEKLAQLDKIIEQYKKDDPDGNAAMAANASKAVDDLRKELDGRAFISEDVFKQELQKATFAIEQKLTLDMAHKNWQATIKTEDFNNWLKIQSEDLQALADSEYAADAITLLDHYQAQKQQAEAEITQASAAKTEKAAKQKQLDDAVPPTTGRETASKRVTTEFEAMMAEFNS